MEIINPNEIGSKISTLIIEAKEKFVAVTPYINIRNWKKITTNIQKAIDRGVDVEIYYREFNNQYDLTQLLDLGVQLFLIPNLHTKLYFNENSLIVSSMNLIESSDLNSLDLAILIENQENQNKIRSYFKDYIYPIRNDALISSRKIIQGRESTFDFLSSQLNTDRIYLNQDKIYSSTACSPFILRVYENSTAISGPDLLDEELITKMNNLIMSFNHESYFDKSNQTWFIKINQTQKNEILAIINCIKKV